MIDPVLFNTLRRFRAGVYGGDHGLGGSGVAKGDVPLRFDLTASLTHALSLLANFAGLRPFLADRPLKLRDDPVVFDHCPFEHVVPNGCLALRISAAGLVRISPGSLE